MEFVLTEHARKRCARRGIKEEWIRAALESPTILESDAYDPDLMHALWAVPEKGFRVLRVVYNEATEPFSVVTAFFDSKANTS